MINTQKSSFQYSNPQIVFFQYDGNVNAPQKEWQMKMSHRKTIARDCDDHALVVLEFMISAGEPDSPFELKSKIQAGFKWEGITEKELPILLNRNAPAILLGFLRPFISIFTNSTGFPPFNLPLIDFSDDPLIDVSLHEDEENDEAN